MRRILMTAAVIAAAVTWVSSQGIRAAGQSSNPQAAKSTPQSAASCVVNGRTHTPCPPGMLKQLKRQTARATAPAQKTGVAAPIAGVSPATSTLSPLAQVGAGPSALALANLGAPDYFGVGNWANSPLPIITNGAVSGGLLKFVDGLPGIRVYNPTGGIVFDAANAAGQYIPVALPDTTTFPGSDFYRIGLKEYTQTFSSQMPAANVRGYFDMGNAADSAPHYLGPIILGTENRAARVLFNNQLATDLTIPADTTYMGAGAVNDGTNTANASLKRATLHLHGGNTPWFSDGTPHTWVTPAGGDGQPNVSGFSKGVSFMNVPDMTGVIPGGGASLQDGYATYYWTNQHSGTMMFYHDHAYGLTRLNVYAGEAAGFLVLDPLEEAAFQTWGVPGFIVTDPVTGAVTAQDLAHMIPLVLQDKTFVADAGGLGSQMAAQDPTWDFAAWGARATSGSRTSTRRTRTRRISPARTASAATTGVRGFGRRSRPVRCCCPRMPAPAWRRQPADGRSRR
jgi:hypothetical protein